MAVAILNQGVWKTAGPGKIAFVQGSNAKLAEALVSPAKFNYWPLRDAQGQTVADDIVGTKDAAYADNLGWATNHPNPFVPAKQHRVVFPVVGGYRDPIYGTTGPLSVECRFRTTNNGPIWGTQAGPAGGNNPTGGWVLNLYVGLSGRLLVGFYPGINIQSAAPVNDGKWHHVVLTWDGTTQYGYLDGLFFGSNTTAPDRSSAWHTDSQLGAGLANGWTDVPAGPVWWYFNGDIEDFAIYKVALSSSELQQRADATPRWTYPAKALIKRGGVGTGFWMDAAYLGFPGVPSTPTVYSETYTSVHAQWNDPPPGSGTPVATYDAQVLGEGGNVIGTASLPPGVKSYNYTGLSSQTRYQFRVRGVSNVGLAGPWSAPLKIQMGRDTIYTPGQALDWRPWYTNYYNPPVGYGGWLVCPNGANVSTHTILFNLGLTSQSGAFTCSPAGRRANYIVDNADAGDIGCWNTEYPDNLYWNYQRGWGVNQVAWQGIFLTGSGWSGTGGQWNAHGHVHLWGNELYWRTWTDVTPAIPNSFW